MIIKSFLKNNVLNLSSGLIYLWFGLLKFFPTMSPAESIAQKTISVLTLNLIPFEIAIVLLAIIETLIGFFLILSIYKRYTIIIALFHIAFTFTPLFLFPKLSFTNTPFALTLLGQYILKNILIIAILITLYSKLERKNALI